MFPHFLVNDKASNSKVRGKSQDVIQAAHDLLKALQEAPEDEIAELSYFNDAAAYEKETNERLEGRGE